MWWFSDCKLYLSQFSSSEDGLSFKNVISITMFQRETHLWPHYIWHRRWVVYVAYHMSFLTYIKYVYFMRQYSVIKLFSHSLEVLIVLVCFNEIYFLMIIYTVTQTGISMWYQPLVWRSSSLYPLHLPQLSPADSDAVHNYRALL